MFVAKPQAIGSTSSTWQNFCGALQKRNTIRGVWWSYFDVTLSILFRSSVVRLLIASVNFLSARAFPVLSKMKVFSIRVVTRASNLRHKFIWEFFHKKTSFWMICWSSEQIVWEPWKSRTHFLSAELKVQTGCFQKLSWIIRKLHVSYLVSMLMTFERDPTISWKTTIVPARHYQYMSEIC